MPGSSHLDSIGALDHPPSEVLTWLDLDLSLASSVLPFTSSCFLPLFNQKIKKENEATTPTATKR